MALDGKCFGRHSPYLPYGELEFKNTLLIYKKKLLTVLMYREITRQFSECALLFLSRTNLENERCASVLQL